MVICHHVWPWLGPKCVLPDSLVQSTTATPLYVGHRDKRGPISLAGPGPPSTLRRLCTGYWIYRTSRRHDPGNADGAVWQLPGPAVRCCECRRSPFSRNSNVVGSFWGRLFWRLVGCWLASFTSAAPVHGQSCISEWK